MDLLRLEEKDSHRDKIPWKAERTWHGTAIYELIENFCSDQLSQ